MTRVPLRAIHWVGDQAYSALAKKSTAETTQWEWKPVTLGAADSTYVEVVSGLEPGDRVSANPKTLPPPPKSMAGFGLGASSSG